MKIEWKSIDKELPKGTCVACFISGHEWFGIGIWEDSKGFTRGFFGEFPGDDGDFIDGGLPFINESVMYWSKISGDYPIRGTNGDESKLLQDHIENG
jgi:hypothetical protein